ncbi:MAG: DUF58 domain-containing protein [Chloroflexota bacterium]|nr:DUF58 domain-containing protein [Chloroflexota bacterium]MDE2895248.1 DUF58 domain-containing protein [Chloroflexota bacterium]
MSRLQRIRKWIAPPLPEARSTAPTLDEVRHQVRQIEVRARRALRDELAGEYRTAFRGRGLEFAELQPYNPGDDVRSIDWKATARLRTPVVRRYVEEREQTVLILVDVSGSMGYAASGPSVRDRAVEIAGVLGLAAAAANDVVGVAAFSTDVVLAVPPAKGSSHVLRILRDLLTLQAEGRTELARALRYAGRVMRKRGVAIVISDFVATHPDHVWEPALAQLSRRHDVVAVCLRDARETALAAAARGSIVHWGGAERGDMILADDRISRTQEQELANERRQMLARLRQCGCDAVMIDTDEDWVPVLIGLFRQRRSRQ